MTILTVTRDLPGEPKGDALKVEPGAVVHYTMQYTGTRLVSVDADGTGLVVVTITAPPTPPTPAT